MTAEQSAYGLLGVKPGASIAELKVAYRDMAKVWHPDRFGHDETSLAANELMPRN